MQYALSIVAVEEVRYDTVKMLCAILFERRYGYLIIDTG